MSLQLEICKNHPGVLAGWRCTHCGGAFCDACIKKIPVGPTFAHTCKDCGERVASITAAAESAEKEVQDQRKRNFFARLPGAFLYPFKGSGIFLLIIGGLFFGGLRFTRFLYSGIFGLLISIAVTGYLNAFMLSIISRTGTGEDELPDWPGIKDFYDDILRPYFLVLGVLAFSTLPLIIFIGTAVHFKLAAAVFLPGVIVFGALAALYYPMGLLAVAMFDTASALSPKVVIPAMFKALPSYLVACAVLGLVVVVRVASATVFRQIPMLGFILDGMLAFYLLIVGMRILGLLYYANAERFGWFGEVADSGNTS